MNALTIIKKTFLNIGRTAGILILGSACGPDGCFLNGQSDCDDTCDEYSHNRSLVLAINDVEEHFFMKQGVKDGNVQPDDYLEFMRKRKKHMLNHLVLTWTGVDVDGKAVGGVLEPNYFDSRGIGTGKIYYTVKESKEWLQRLSEPPVFKIYSDNGDYRDLTFTIDKDYFERKWASPCESNGLEEYYLQYYYATCIFVQRKVYDPELCGSRCDWSPYDDPDESINTWWSCYGNGFRLIEY